MITWSVRVSSGWGHALFNILSPTHFPIQFKPGNLPHDIVWTFFYSYTKRKVQDPGRSDRWWTNPQGRRSNHSNGQTSCLLRLSYGKLLSVGLKTLQHLIQCFAKLLKMVIILFVVSRPRHVWWNRISLLRSRLPQIVSRLYTLFLHGEGKFMYCLWINGSTFL